MKTIGLKIVVPVEAQNEPLQDEVEIEEVVDETAEEVVYETAKKGKNKK